MTPWFKNVSKPYDCYINELRAWPLITDLEKEKQHVAIALSFQKMIPRDKVFNKLPLDNLNRDDSVETYTTYLKKLFKMGRLNSEKITKIYKIWWIY